MEATSYKGLGYEELSNIYKQLQTDIKILNASNLLNNRKIRYCREELKELNSYIMQTFCYDVEEIFVGD